LLALLDRLAAFLELVTLQVNSWAVLVLPVLVLLEQARRALELPVPEQQVLELVPGLLGELGLLGARLALQVLVQLLYP
jgi:hypothetical protein